MSDREKLERWRDYIKIAQNCENWAYYLEARGDHRGAAAIRRAAKEYRDKAKRLRPES